MATARDIVTSALRKIHVIGLGASLDSDEADQALSTLNDMLTSYSAEGAMIFDETLESFSLTANQSSYTVGSGLDFNTTAPLYIMNAYVRQGTIDYPLKIVDSNQYSAIAQKSLSGSVPLVLYYDSNYSSPKIYLYPVPASADTLYMTSAKALTEFTDLDTAFAMPAHYKAMLVHNLAVWIAPEYEREASPTIQGIAARTKKTVIAQNRRNEHFNATLEGIPGGGSPAYTDQNILGGYFS